MRLRVLATFVAVALAGFIAADVPGLPAWASAVLGGLVAGFAAVGIYPPGSGGPRTPV